MAKNNKGKVASSGRKAPLAGGVSAQAPQQTKAEKKPLMRRKGAGIVLALVVTVAVVALGAFHLIVRNSDMLSMAQSKSFFTTNNVFMAECMRQPGGVVTWLASFLMQFFYHPALGATIMLAMWVASMWLSLLAFRVKAAWMAVLAIPVVCLLVGVIDTGYWLYYLKQAGYWFYGTVGYLIAVVEVFIHGCFKRRTDKIIVKILIACTYPFFGWYALLALLYTAVIAPTETTNDKRVIDKVVQPALAVVLALVMPLACYRLYPELRFEEAWTCGFPYFTNDKLISFSRELPFIILAAVPLIFPLLPKQEQSRFFTGGVLIATVAILIASWIWVDKRDFQNYNYHAEMRMYRAAEEQDWDKVLDEMADIPGDASREMVLLKNIALLNKGEMGTKMYRYNNMGETPANGFDTLRVHMVQTAAPLIYYYHGKTNFALRWCIENSVEFGYSFDNLKMLARCALVGGEMDAARRYLDILKTSMYYKDWAEHLMPITEKPELIKKYPEFDSVRELRDNMGSVLDGDNGLCEMYLLNYFSNTMNKDCKLLQELTLNYAMVQKDISLFWPRFFLYAQLHPDGKMPVHYQEAAFLYGNLEPNNVNIQNMPFDTTIKERYQSFQQMSQQLLATGMQVPQVGEAMKSSYGDTFYWFYFFCRDIHSY